MILKFRHKFFETFLFAGPRFSFEFKVVVNFHTILPNGDHGIFDLLTFAVETGRFEFDIISLPLKRWETHIKIGSFVTVQRAAMVEFEIESERVQDLYFITLLNVTAAIPAILSDPIGFIG